MSTRILFSLVIALLMSSSFGKFAQAELLFESNFDSTTIRSQSTPYNRWYIEGTDVSTGYDWETDITSIPHTRGITYGNYGYNTFGTGSVAEIVADPDDAANNVLHFEHRVLTDTARLSLGLNYNYDGTTPPFTEGYSKFRMRLSDAFSFLQTESYQIDWLVIQELFQYNDESWTNTDRLSFSIHKDWPAGSPLYWDIAAHSMAGSPDWFDYENRTVPVPIEQWFTVETYVKASPNANEGRIWIAITVDGQETQVLFDLQVVTQDPIAPMPFGDWAPFKLYMPDGVAMNCYNNGTPIGIWWDDFEYHSTRPVSSVAPMPPSLVSAN